VPKRPPTDFQPRWGFSVPIDDSKVEIKGAPENKLETETKTKMEETADEVMKFVDQMVIGIWRAWYRAFDLDNLKDPRLVKMLATKFSASYLNTC